MWYNIFYMLNKKEGSDSISSSTLSKVFWILVVLGLILGFVYYFVFKPKAFVQRPVAILSSEEERTVLNELNRSQLPVLTSEEEARILSELNRPQFPALTPEEEREILGRL